MCTSLKNRSLKIDKIPGRQHVAVNFCVRNLRHAMYLYDVYEAYQGQEVTQTSCMVYLAVPLTKLYFYTRRTWSSRQGTAYYRIIFVLTDEYYNASLKYNPRLHWTVNKKNFKGFAILFMKGFRIDACSYSEAFSRTCGSCRFFYVHTYSYTITSNWKFWKFSWMKIQLNFQKVFWYKNSVLWSNCYNFIVTV